MFATLKWKIYIFRLDSNASGGNGDGLAVVMARTREKALQMLKKRSDVEWKLEEIIIEMPKSSRVVADRYWIE